MTDKNGQDGTDKVMLGSFSDGKKLLERKLKDGTTTTKYQAVHLTGTGWHTDEDATEEMFIDEMQKLIKHHRKLNIRFGIFNLEINMSKNLHWQWYMQMKEKIYFHHFNKALKKLKIKLHFSMYQTGGTTMQNIEYCSKGTGWWTYADGTEKYNITVLPEPVIIGSMDDMVIKGHGNKKANREQIANDIYNSGSRLTGLIDTHTVEYLRNSTGVVSLKHMGDRKRYRGQQIERTNFYLWSGEEGTGKTTDVLSGKFAKRFGYTADDVYIITPVKGRPLWFDGYDGEKVILIDDLAPRILDRNYLLQLMENNICDMEVKGSKVVLTHEFVFVTSNYPADAVFQKQEWVKITHDHEGNEIEPYWAQEWVDDNAIMSRFNGIVPYGNQPNFRKQRKKQSRLSVEELFSDEGQQYWDNIDELRAVNRHGDLLLPPCLGAGSEMSQDNEGVGRQPSDHPQNSTADLVGSNLESVGSLLDFAGSTKKEVI